MTPIEALKWAAPSILTIGALVCGLTAVRFSAEGEYDSCVKCIFLACVLDGLDGHTARALGTSSKFGFELDSLCDLANFGVSPALVVHFWLRSLPTEANNLGTALEWFACCAHAGCCALRLARFNVEGHAAQMDKQHDVVAGEAKSSQPHHRSGLRGTPLVQNVLKRKMYFNGVPAPIGAAYALAPITLSLSRLPEHFGSIGELGAWAVGRRGTAVMLLVTAMLMVSPMPTLSSKMLKSGAKSSHLRSRYTVTNVVKICFGSLVVFTVFSAPFESFLGLVVIHGLSIPFGLAVFYLAATEGQEKTKLK